MAPPPHEETTVTASSEGTEEPEECAGDEKISLGGAAWDSLSQPSHLPSAIIGLGPVERAQYFLKQREVSRVEGEKLRAQKRKAMEVSRHRIKDRRSVDDHFTGRTMEAPELRAGLSGLMSRDALRGEEKDSAAENAAEGALSRKKMRRSKKKKKITDRQKLSFDTFEPSEDAI